MAWKSTCGGGCIKLKSLRPSKPDTKVTSKGQGSKILDAFSNVLNTGQMRVSRSEDPCCWILRGEFFRGGIRNSARICNGFIEGFAPKWDYVSCPSAFCNPVCPRATLAQGVAEVANTTSFSSSPALSPLSWTQGHCIWSQSATKLWYSYQNQDQTYCCCVPCGFFLLRICSVFPALPKTRHSNHARSKEWFW